MMPLTATSALRLHLLLIYWPADDYAILTTAGLHHDVLLIVVLQRLLPKHPGD
jgi:hypothetical protein